MASEYVKLGEEEERIREIQKKVVGMYSEHPWPGGTRNADEEMGWRLRVLGIQKEDYQGKRVLEMGCGTGEYASWYAVNGAKEVVGVDLSDGSLAIAREGAATKQIKNIQFLKQDVLKLDLPDNSFDYAYSVGMLMITGDPYKGFQHLCRVTKPGGIVVVSLYNSYGWFWMRIRHRILKTLVGDDADKRVRVAKWLFPLTINSLNKRYHGVNTEEIIYDIFGFPHESVHTAEEVLEWFDKNNIDYIGSFAPLRLKDYIYAFSLPEYKEFRATFSGFPLMRMVGDFLSKLSTTVLKPDLDKEGKVRFERPSGFSMLVCQLIWLFFGTRFNCFTIAGRKR